MSDSTRFNEHQSAPDPDEATAGGSAMIQAHWLPPTTATSGVPGRSDPTGIQDALTNLKVDELTSRFFNGNHSKYTLILVSRTRS